MALALIFAFLVVRGLGISALDDSEICASVEENPTRYILPHPTDCSKYYQCEKLAYGQGWKAHPMDCSNGLAFDEVIMACNHIQAVPRCSPQDDNAICASVADNPTRYLVPDCEDCSKFWECQQHGTTSGWIAHPMNCPSNTVFDEVLMVCNYIHAVPRCSPQADNKICASVADNPTRYLVPHCTECTKYYECHQHGTTSGWIAHPMDCPPNTAFVPELMVCDYLDNVPRCTNQWLVSSLCLTDKEDKPCVFPFIYKGETYQSCTKVDHHDWWCSVSTDTTGHLITGQWGHCNSACPKTKDQIAGLCLTDKEDKPCVFPFIYKGETYQSCTKVDHDDWWCSISTDTTGHHITGQWGHCNSACPKDQKPEQRNSITYCDVSPSDVDVGDYNGVDNICGKSNGGYGTGNSNGGNYNGGSSNGGSSNGGNSNGGSSNGGNSNGGSSNGGSSNGGSSNGGSSNGGSSNGGSSNGGNSNGGNSNGGNSNSGNSNGGSSNGGNSNSGDSNDETKPDIGHFNDDEEDGEDDDNKEDTNDEHGTTCSMVPSLDNIVGFVTCFLDTIIGG